MGFSAGHLVGYALGGALTFVVLLVSTTDICIPSLIYRLIFGLLDGVFEDEHGTYLKGRWLRSPHLSAHNPFTGPHGALIHVRTGHLATT